MRRRNPAAPCRRGSAGRGRETENTFCITKGRYAIPSQHIGDLENYETLQFFERRWGNLSSVYQAQPRSSRTIFTPTISVRAGPCAVPNRSSQCNTTTRMLRVAWRRRLDGKSVPAWLLMARASVRRAGLGGEFLLLRLQRVRTAARICAMCLCLVENRAARQGWRMAAAPALFDALGPGSGTWRFPADAGESLGLGR